VVALRSGSRAIGRLLVLLALVGLSWLAFRLLPEQRLVSVAGIERLRDLLRESWWGPPVFVVCYALATTLDFSGLALTLVGGAVFGFWWGVLLNSIGANLGANGAFWLARVLGREGLRSLLGARLAPFDRVTLERGPLWLFRLRLIPLVPFNVLNVAAGLSAMPWPGYAAATGAGMLPGTLVYTYFADALVAGAAGSAQAALGRLGVAAGLLVVLSLTPALARRAGWVEGSP
jgi:uncharacterized membrane protein YdjX (TVP38/TMEM64 family)